MCTFGDCEVLFPFALSNAMLGSFTLDAGLHAKNPEVITHLKIALNMCKQYFGKEVHNGSCLMFCDYDYM